MPPKEMPPAELWLRLTQLPRAQETVDYPRKDPVTGEPIGKVVMQVLTQEEQMACQIQAERFAKERLKEIDSKSIGYEDLYKNASAVEVLYRVCKREEDPTLPFFPSPKLMRETLSADEVGVLLSTYLEVQTKLGPIVSKMSEVEMDAWIARLAEGGSTFPLALLSWEAKSDLIMYMASRLSASLTDTTSHGSPPEEPPQNDPEAA